MRTNTEHQSACDIVFFLIRAAARGQENMEAIEMENLLEEIRVDAGVQTPAMEEPPSASAPPTVIYPMIGLQSPTRQSRHQLHPPSTRHLAQRRPRNRRAQRRRR